MFRFPFPLSVKAKVKYRFATTSFEQLHKKFSIACLIQPIPANLPLIYSHTKIISGIFRKLWYRKSPLASLVYWCFDPMNGSYFEPSSRISPIWELIFGAFGFPSHFKWGFYLHDFFHFSLNTKARYKRPLPWEAQSHLSINLRGVRIKSNMAANSNTRKINKHEINTVFFFFFAFVKFRNATAIENIFALDKYNSRRVFYRGVERLVRRQIWPSWSHERRKQSHQQGIVAQIDLIKAWIRSLFRQI